MWLGSGEVPAPRRAGPGPGPGPGAWLWRWPRGGSRRCGKRRGLRGHRPPRGHRAVLLSCPGPPCFSPASAGSGGFWGCGPRPRPSGQAPTALSAVADGRAWRGFSVLSGELGLRVWPAPMVPLVSPGGRCPPRAWEERGLCEPGAHCQPLLPPTGAGSDPPGLPRSAVQLCLRGPPRGRGRRRERRC